MQATLKSDITSVAVGCDMIKIPFSPRRAYRIEDISHAIAYIANPIRDLYRCVVSLRALRIWNRHFYQKNREDNTFAIKNLKAATPPFLLQ